MVANTTATAMRWRATCPLVRSVCVTYSAAAITPGSIRIAARASGAGLVSLANPRSWVTAATRTRCTTIQTRNATCSRMGSCSVPQSALPARDARFDRVKTRVQGQRQGPPSARPPRVRHDQLLHGHRGGADQPEPLDELLGHDVRPGCESMTARGCRREERHEETTARRGCWRGRAAPADRSAAPGTACGPPARWIVKEGNHKSTRSQCSRSRPAARLDWRGPRLPVHDRWLLSVPHTVPELHRSQHLFPAGGAPLRLDLLGVPVDVCLTAQVEQGVADPVGQHSGLRTLVSSSSTPPRP